MRVELFHFLDDDLPLFSVEKIDVHVFVLDSVVVHEFFGSLAVAAGTDGIHLDFHCRLLFLQ